MVSVLLLYLQFKIFAAIKINSKDKRMNTIKIIYFMVASTLYYPVYKYIIKKNRHQFIDYRAFLIYSVENKIINMVIGVN